MKGLDREMFGICSKYSVYPEKLISAIRKDCFGEDYPLLFWVESEAKKYIKKYLYSFENDFVVVRVMISIEEAIYD